MARWPRAVCLASAAPADAIGAWSGLGYNRRAVRLQRAAVEVSQRHGGTVPTDPHMLRRLPGVGGYTASAVASFAANQPVAVVDTNIARVLSRIVRGIDGAAPGSAAMHAMATEALPSSDTRDWNLALMDLGATVCTARQPSCTACPVSNWCAWRNAGQPRPSTGTSARPPRFETTARFARGRLVAALRAGPLPLQSLVAATGEQHELRVPGYLEALAREGLVEQIAPGSWRLPGDRRPIRGE